jgi:hypothetical protein
MATAMEELNATIDHAVGYSENIMATVKMTTERIKLFQ